VPSKIPEINSGHCRTVIDRSAQKSGNSFLRVPTDWRPVLRAVWLCALYIGVPLAAGYLVFLRRDVAGD